MSVGVIGGSNLYKTFLFTKAEKKVVETAYGTVELYESSNIHFVPRHGSHMNKPPHLVNHHANIQALHDVGAANIIGLCMVGSLKREIKPPSIVIPHDYISFSNVPTFFDRKIVHITPSLNEPLRQHILSIARENRIKLHDKGVYVQTAGPRLETEAEINVIKKWGDVVGMTMASEAILAQERGLAYAAVCTVDNYAHGISKEILDFKRVMEEAASHSKKAVDFVVKAAEGLG